MTIDITPLFTPLTVKTKTLRNRIVMPPMVQVRDIISPDGIEWYARRARGGAALVIVEATGVNRFGDRGDSHGDLTVDTLKPLIDAVHEAGALIAVQLFPVTFGRPATPASIDAEEIAEIFAQYQTAARVCAAAGFDGVQPHGAHGFLINQFFSPEQNQRTDGWNGDIDARMRFASTIVDAIRPICDASGMLLLYRHTPVGKGYGIEESHVLAQALVAAGVDVLDLSPSSVDAPGDRSAPFMDLGVPCIAVNNLDVVEHALEVLNEGRADLVAIGRGLIADPDWPIKVQAGRFDDIVKCIKCDVKCYGNLRKRIPVECTQWA